ncbi:unnamed protein product [Schistosoma curassoni]|uniref:PPM-type phosphatase domain-containing protein n=1 Tax=Schistosoma curassoni TaxID=6186 RepID=A0A183JHF0_9TREM|nr:unnamed protein product [Schistosoma curassoni]
MQKETVSVAAASPPVRLNIHKHKTKILRYNTACNNPITLDGKDSEDVKTVTYLGSIIDEHGGCGADVEARIGKEIAPYLQLKNIWNSKHLSTNTKASPHMKSSRPKNNNNKKTKEHITSRNGDRHEKNEQK